MVSINHAIKMTKYAIQSIPKESPSLLGLNNFGMILEAWYRQTGWMADLEEAI